MKIGPLTTLEDMAYIVGTALYDSGIEAVLSGAVGANG
jgi:hypothetical protein